MVNEIWSDLRVCKNKVRQFGRTAGQGGENAHNTSEADKNWLAGRYALIGEVNFEKQLLVDEAEKVLGLQAG